MHNEDGIIEKTPRSYTTLTLVTAIIISLLIGFVGGTYMGIAVVGQQLLEPIDATDDNPTLTEPVDDNCDEYEFSDIIVEDSEVAYKPIIYLYPTEDTNINVQLGYPENITCSYPKYTDGWNVQAMPNGDLTDLDTGRNLYSLYYENINEVVFRQTDEGFCVQGKNIAGFLEEKLEILGLSPHEIEEFIIYWLPKLEENEYNYIRFATAEEIEQNMPLTIIPEPDNVIRVLMVYAGLEEEIELIEQELTSPERTGFTVVEWGGTEAVNSVYCNTKMPCGGIRVPKVKIPKFSD